MNVRCLRTSRPVRPAAVVVGVLFALVLMLGVGSCARPAKTGDRSAAPAQPISTTAEHNSVTLAVTADRSAARVAEPVRVTVRVEAPAEAEVTLPDLSATVEDLLVRDHGVVETRTVEDRQTLTQWWELDSNLSGARVVPALTIELPDGQVTTEPLTITVDSAIEGEFNPTEFVDIEGPIGLERPFDWRRAVLYGSLAGLAVTAVAILVILWWRRRRAERIAKARSLPPHQWALQQLDGLLAEKLIEQDRMQDFYYRLSRIVRVYIELRFGLMAPERTTQEFLAELSRSNALRYTHKDLLDEFLRACDLVKYACHQPRGAEIDGSVDAARRFVRETAPVQEATYVSGRPRQETAA